MCNHNNFKCSLCCADASTASQGRSYAESSILKPQTRAHHIVLREECFSGWQLPVPCVHRLWHGQCHCGEHTGICDWSNVCLHTDTAAFLATSTSKHWWSFSAEIAAKFWIEVFDQLTEAGVFHRKNPMEVVCLRYCFINVVQSDLDEIRRHLARRVLAAPGTVSYTHLTLPTNREV